MYELMVVSTIDGAASVFEKLEKFLKTAEAQIIKSEKLGKKRLAYPIAKQTEAEYFLFNFEAPTQSILQLSTSIRQEQETILRYLLIKTKISKAPRVRKVSKVEEKVEEPKAEVKPKVTVTTKIKPSQKETKPVKSKPAKKGAVKK